MRRKIKRLEAAARRQPVRTYTYIEAEINPRFKMAIASNVLDKNPTAFAAPSIMFNYSFALLAGGRTPDERIYRYPVWESLQN